MLLYYITDRTQFSGDEDRRREQLLERIGQAARYGVDCVQLREKDLCARDLEILARAALKAIRATGAKTRLLINSRTDVALAVGADGVHLRSTDVSPVDVHQMWRSAGRTEEPIVAVSCHTDTEVSAAKYGKANFVVFGPVFGKPGGDENPAGLESLKKVCSHEIPVLALGGISRESVEPCLQAGAAGIAGIRLFQNGDMETTIRTIRALSTSG